MPPLFSFYIYLTKGMKGWITFSKKILKKDGGIEKSTAYSGAFLPLVMNECVALCLHLYTLAECFRQLGR
ncbi:hypothetical protein ELP67_17450 [Bacillus safensis]|nr:hypothetical protein ELP67_17450 [Bacillus safensis]